MFQAFAKFFQARLVPSKWVARRVNVLGAIAWTMGIYAILSSAPVQAAQLKLQRRFPVRHLANGSVNPVAILAPGSIIGIPDAYVVNGSDGKPDVERSLGAWMSQRGLRTDTPIGSGHLPDEASAERNDLFFPIRIIAASPNSDAAGIEIGTTYYMALRVLSTSGGLQPVSEEDVIAEAPAATGVEPLLRSRAFNDAQRARIAQVHRVAPPSTIPTATIRQNPRPSMAAQTLPCDGTCGQYPQALSPQARESMQLALAAIQRAPTSGYQAAPSAAPRSREILSNRPPASGEQSAATRFLGQTFPNRISRDENLPRSCYNFIDREGKLGPWGRLISNEVMRYPSLRSNNNRMTDICRNFNSFTDAQKTHYIVFFMGALSIHESGCNVEKPAPPNANPNGVAIGLFQLELNANLRRRRGPACIGNIYTAEVQIRCAGKTLDHLLSHGQGPLYPSTSINYWGPLYNRKDNIAQTIMRSYRACGNPD